MVVSFRRLPHLSRWPLMVSMLALLILLSACQHQRLLSRTPPPETTAPPAPVVEAPPPEPALPPTPPPEPEPPAQVVEAPPVIEPVAPLEAMIPPPVLTLLPGPVSVALLLPLSGPSADLGRALLDAAQLALFDVSNEDFVLLPRDTAPDTAPAFAV